MMTKTGAMIHVAKMDAVMEKNVNFIQHIRITSSVNKNREVDDAKTHAMSTRWFIVSCGDLCIAFGS